MNTPFDWLRQACADFVRTLPPSAQSPTAAAADFHLQAIAKDLAELAAVREKFQRLQQEMDQVGAASLTEDG